MELSELLPAVGKKASITHDNGVGEVAIHGWITGWAVHPEGEISVTVETRSEKGLVRSVHTIAASNIVNVAVFKNQPQGGATQ